MQIVQTTKINKVMLFRYEINMIYDKNDRFFPGIWLGLNKVNLSIIF